MIVLFISLSLYTAIVAYLWFGIAKTIVPCDKALHPVVSIIIAVKNNQNTIKACLRACLDQVYNKNRFKIYVIDDGSTDQSRSIIRSIAKRNDRIVFLQKSSSQNWKSSKKEALQQAIQQAKGEVLLFTDADCFPPPTWLSGMVKAFDESTGAVIGFSLQFSCRNLLNRFLRMDALASAYVAAASLGHRRPITACGRNIAVSTGALEKIKGFANLPDSLSGDDDFLLQSISKNTNLKINYQYDLHTHVPAQGPDSWMAFWMQKSRHLSAGHYYPLQAQIGYFIYHLSNLILWIAGVAGFFMNAYFIPFLAIKLIIDAIAMQPFSNKLDRKINPFDFTIWNVIFPLYHLVCTPVSLLKKQKW